MRDYSSVQPPFADKRAALVVAHPSHELRVHGWLQLTRPTVFVITDGSGRFSQPRLASTTKVLAEVGSAQGSIYGRVTDLQLYAAILNQDLDFFIAMADELAGSFVSQRIDYVAGDAAEGYRSAHDICRLLINAAIEIVSRKHRHNIPNFHFLVIGPPRRYAGSPITEKIWIQLDDDMFARKLGTARAYHPRLAEDIDAALRGEGFQGIKRLSEPQLARQVDVEVGKTIMLAIKSQPKLEARVKEILRGVELDAFRVECLSSIGDGKPGMGDVPPFYEIYAEKLVAAGCYERVIRYREHIFPVAQALWRHVECCV